MACPSGNWPESSLLENTVVMMHRVCDGNVHRQSHVRWSGIRLTTFSQQKKLFLYDFASQSSGGQPMPADGVAGG